jgi:hypothetical protein
MKILLSHNNNNLHTYIIQQSGFGRDRDYGGPPPPRGPPPPYDAYGPGGGGPYGPGAGGKFIFFLSK